MTHIVTVSGFDFQEDPRLPGTLRIVGRDGLVCLAKVLPPNKWRAIPVIRVISVFHEGEQMETYEDLYSDGAVAAAMADMSSRGF